ncbi:MAG: hypothetical protein AAF602_18190, partial [Myxococcota bacterium]
QTFDRIGSLEAAMETSVISIPWGYWQRSDDGKDCSSIPDPKTASNPELYAFWDATYGIWGASDSWWTYYELYYWMTAAEMGVPDVPRGHLLDLGLIEPDAATVEEGLHPTDAPVPQFDSATLTATRNWLASDASDVVLVFGEYDPWSAAQPNELATDVHLFVAPRGNHQSNLGSLTETDFDEAWSEMASWFAP